MLTSSSSGRLRDWIHRVNAGWDRRGDIVSLTESIRRSRPSPRRAAAPHRCPRTRILFLTHYFPPEGNAPASRVHEMCKRWARDGHEVTVITCAPNHPTGIVYKGYRNWLLQQEWMDGIRVLRVWTFLAANRGKGRRAINFVSYMIMATLLALFLRRRDVLIATSPQFFCGWAGVLVTALRRIPFILEIRDIWPESIHAVGASERNLLLWLLERMEQQMYASAFKIVTVGQGYKEQLIKRGVPEAKIQIVTNGVDRELFVSHHTDQSVRAQYGLGKAFVCAYVGTIGLAAGLDVVLRAGAILKQRGRKDIRLLMVGDGATRERLERAARQQGLDNIIFTGLIGRQLVPQLLSAVDACLVHLRRKELFESVLPSKIFEAAGMQKPIILGVKGHAARLVNEAGCGICIEPENAEQLVEAIEKLAADPELARRLGQSGHDYVRRHFDRDQLAEQYFQIIREAIETCPIVV
ncbi:glycosyltransferase family 4 protein [Fontivita pretiosa]|uniref:glycosyltransferase family 4 protein n=1 Tax=Fontivita pretiosa TaxID=2989684 RepID=UPI003D16491B